MKWILFALFLFLPTYNQASEDTSLTDEEILSSVGQVEEEEEIADRDNDIPLLYDRNRMALMKKREKWMRRNGICCPAHVAPGTNGCVPCPKVNPYYDIENRRYKRPPYR